MYIHHKLLHITVKTRSVKKKENSKVVEIIIQNSPSKS